MRILKPLILASVALVCAVGVWTIFSEAKRRITKEALEEMLKRDREHACAIVQEEQRKSLERMSPEQRKWWSEAMPELLDKADLVGDGVKQWVLMNCQMDDGLIPLLNFEQMAIFFPGHRFVIKDGVADSIHYCSRLNSKGGYNLKCPCPECVGILGTI